MQKAEKTLRAFTELVDLLSDEKGSLNQALLKTKVLLYRLGHQELTEWVNDELNGYSRDKEVPEYRVIGARVMGVITNGFNVRYPSHPIPTMGLQQSRRDYLETEKLRQPLAVLEQWGLDPASRLSTNIPLELNGELGEALSGGFFVERAWQEITGAQVMQVLVQVRSRLLTFILEMQASLGENVEEEEVKKAAASVDTPAMFNNAIFGDNTTFVVGNSNTTTVRNLVKRGDFHSLAKHLRDNGVSEADVAALKEAIDADVDAPELQAGKLGPRVRSWTSGMLGKAVELAWQVDVAVAGGLLTNAIQAYYFS